MMEENNDKIPRHIFFFFSFKELRRDYKTFGDQINNNWFERIDWHIAVCVCVYESVPTAGAFSFSEIV